MPLPRRCLSSICSSSVTSEAPFACLCLLYLHYLCASQCLSGDACPSQAPGRGTCDATLKHTVHCRAAKAALYHADSCSSFVSAAEELQAVLLSGNVTHLRPGFLLEYENILQEALCIFTRFSDT